MIAHLPAGYLTGRTLAPSGAVLWAAVLGGIFPDFDMIWFYFVDDRAFHHHAYWVHIPAFWAAVALVALPLIRWQRPDWFAPAVAFLLAIFVHLCLDTLAGDIKWRWPFSDEFYHLVTVPARYDNWVWNFILHPVFLAEIAIWAAALFVWRRRQ